MLLSLKISAHRGKNSGRDRFIMTEERILAAIEAEGLKASKQSLADYYRQKNTLTTSPRRSRLERVAV